jgi:hypothetical protein
MFARLQTSRTASSPDGAERAAALLESLAARPGFAGAWLLRPVAASDGALLTLWRTRDDAGPVAEPAAAVHDRRPLGVRIDSLYRVEDDVPGPDVDDEPAFAQLVHFDGPRTPEWSAAVLRADRERLTPATRDIPGSVRTLVLVTDENAHLVVSLTTSVTTIEVAQQRIMATELLPWEEPALLTGPDRIDLQRVVASRRPAPAVTA